MPKLALSVGRRSRFPGAGLSAEKEFNRERRQNVKESWRVWLALTAGTVGFVAASAVTDGNGSRALALGAGLLVGVMLAMWAIGGHYTAFSWWIGAEGERSTAREIEKLGSSWHCEHDIRHGYGNYDHVLVGPSGIYLVDTKTVGRGTCRVTDDKLTCGNVRHPGHGFRGAALALHKSLEAKLGSRPPFVHPVVVIWGDFPQRMLNENGVTYLDGSHLAAHLSELPGSLNAPQRAAVVAALRQVRARSRLENT